LAQSLRRDQVSAGAVKRSKAQMFKQLSVTEDDDMHALTYIKITYVGIFVFMIVKGIDAVAHVLSVMPMLH